MSRLLDADELAEAWVDVQLGNWAPIHQIQWHIEALEAELEAERYEADRLRAGVEAAVASHKQVTQRG